MNFDPIIGTVEARYLHMFITNCALSIFFFLLPSFYFINKMLEVSISLLFR